MTGGIARSMPPRRLVLGLLGLALLPRGTASAASAGSDADRAAVVLSNNAFSLDLYAKLATTNGNLFYSPYSISSALAMTWAGARGATADEMARTLRVAVEPGRFHPAFASAMRDLTGAKRAGPGELHTANALWSRKGVLFAPGFLTIARTSYGAGVEQVDFKGATETARRTINAWVERETQDRIKDLIREGVLTPDTVLVLTNAIYFKGNWVRAFSKDYTHPGEFSRGVQGTVGGVPFMHQVDASYRYLETESFQALDLPYKNELSMIVFLPRAVDGLADFEKTLTAMRLADWVAQMKPTTVDVALPRFTVTAPLSLRKVLIALGMPLAFDERRADFSGMIERGGAFLGAVEHKAFVEVNETGTEAAAATAVVSRLASARIQPLFRANHPFLFVIRDSRSGIILFVGRLTEPKAG